MIKSLILKKASKKNFRSRPTARGLRDELVIRDEYIDFILLVIYYMGFGFVDVILSYIAVNFELLTAAGQKFAA